MIKLDGRESSISASRGQERTVVLALFLLTSSFVELRRMERPVVLLDDACSELDALHQEQLVHALMGYQVFLTSAHELPMRGIEHMRIESGRIVR